MATSFGNSINKKTINTKLQKADLIRFNKLKDIASASGYELLNTEWLGSETKHLFKHLESGKIYERTPHYILDSGFPKDIRYDLDDLKKFAIENGFELLNKQWEGAKAYYQFKSLDPDNKNIYTWQATWLINNGIPKDLRKDTDKLKNLVKHALEHGFEVVDKEWQGIKNRHTFKHIETGKLYHWITDNILNRGFPKDLNKLLTDSERLERLSKKAIENGFELLDKQWLGDKTKYQFKHIENGTLYQAFSNNILRFGFPKSLFKSVNNSKLTSDINIKQSPKIKNLTFESVSHAENEFKKSNQLKKENEFFNKLQKLSIDNGFELIETEWLGLNKEYQFQKNDTGRIYKWLPTYIMSNGFPKDLRTDIDKLNELAAYSKSKNYELLNQVWLGLKKKYQFKNNDTGRIYEATANDILKNGFRNNSRNPLNMFNALAQYAVEHGFELLETEWLGSERKHRFKHLQSGKIYSWLSRQVIKRGFPKSLSSNSLNGKNLENVSTLKDSEHKLFQLEKLKKKSISNGFELLDQKWLGATAIHRFKNIENGKIYEWSSSRILNVGFPKNFKTSEEKLNKSIKVSTKQDSIRFSEWGNKATENGFELMETQWLGMEKEHRFKNLISGLIYKWKPKQLKYNGFPKFTSSGFQLKPLTNEAKFENLAARAIANGYALLETQWLGQTIKHRFKHIASGKLYESKPSTINNRGFPKLLCTDEERFNNLYEKSLASGYMLLETKWLGAAVKHRFKHIDSGVLYNGAPHVVLGKNGFPLAGGQRFLTEEVCRQALIHIFGGSFKSDSSRLRNKHGKHLQLDGLSEYNDGNPFLMSTLGINIKEIAFEFQGHPNHFDNKDVMARDALRVKYCDEEGILLIVIDPPADWENIRISEYMFEHVCSAIRQKLPALKDTTFPQGFKIDLLNWKPDVDNYNKLKEYAKTKGFELMETQWLGRNTKHQFKHIESGLLYSSIPSNFFKSRFEKDIREGPTKLNELKMLGENHGFELLDEEWKGSSTKYLFRHIESGALYEGMVCQIRKKGFPKDLRTGKDRLKELFVLAQQNQFELLTKKWTNEKSIYQFKHIESGVIYEDTAVRIKSRGFSKDARYYKEPVDILESQKVYPIKINGVQQDIGNLLFDDVSSVENLISLDKEDIKSKISNELKSKDDEFKPS